MATPNAEIWSVAQLTRRIKGLLENEIGSVWVSGEISNWKVAASGHAYFTLKDADAQIDAVIFKGRLSRLRFEPESGLEVLAQGSVSVYERRGNYQIILNDMQPKGVGALQLAFEKLKKKLSEEGLFDDAIKKPLPRFPKKIGIVTSPTGAAIRDILNVINRRFAHVHILLHPARVQGDEAAPEIAHAIQTLDQQGIDVMIVGRGGGSLEDLWPFNEEVVVRAIHQATTPIISAVGHEVDFSLSDFAADLRAPTPSAAAELVVQEQQALADQLQLFKKRMWRGLNFGLQQVRHRLEQAKASYTFQQPEELFRQHQQECDDLRMRLEDALVEQARNQRHRLEKLHRSLELLSPVAKVQRTRDRLHALQQRLIQQRDGGITQGRARLNPLAAKLNALSPIAILDRGYALTFKEPDNTLVRNANELNPNDTVRVRLGKGSIRATVNTIEDTPNA